jgi:hypothetical protein
LSHGCLRNANWDIVVVTGGLPSPGIAAHRLWSLAHLLGYESAFAYAGTTSQQHIAPAVGKMSHRRPDPFLEPMPPHKILMAFDFQATVDNLLAPAGVGIYLELGDACARVSAQMSRNSAWGSSASRDESIRWISPRCVSATMTVWMRGTARSRATARSFSNSPPTLSRFTLGIHCRRDGDARELHVLEQIPCLLMLHTVLPHAFCCLPVVCTYSQLYTRTLPTSCRWAFPARSFCSASSRKRIV